MNQSEHVNENLPPDYAQRLNTDYLSELNHLLETADADAWAKAFVREFSDNPTLLIDEALMTAWFANTIMAMHYHALRQQRSVDDNNELEPTEQW